MGWKDAVRALVGEDEKQRRPRSGTGARERREALEDGYTHYLEQSLAEQSVCGQPFPHYRWKDGIHIRAQVTCPECLEVLAERER